MQISLETVREEPFAWQEQLTFLADRLCNPDLIELGPVSVEGRVEFFDPSFLLQSKYRYRQKLACCRCLQPIEQGNERRDRVSYRGRRIPGTSGAEVKLESGDLGCIQVITEEIETESIVIGELQLNVPMKPLCQTDCKGLCGECGADLNLEECRCESAPIDPRWQALAALRGSSDDKD